MNSISLIGRLTKDPELKYTSGNNTATTSFTIAVNRDFAKDGQPTADFINIVTWAKTAEFVGKYFSKGLQVGIVGRLQTRNWDDNEGKKHYVTEVVADRVYFADSKKSGNEQHSDAHEQPAQHDFTVPAADPTEDDELPF
jgi:single-strand DNA-binding protein